MNENDDKENAGGNGHKEETQTSTQFEHLQGDDWAEVNDESVSLTDYFDVIDKVDPDHDAESTN